MKPELARELDAAVGFWFDRYPAPMKRLKALGLKLPDPAKTHAPVAWGLAPIVEAGAGVYEPRAGGDLAMVLPLHDGGGTLIDLMAWRSQAIHAQAWLQRTGAASLLGAPAAHWAIWTDAPLRLHASPAAWLRAAGEGACVLDWDAPEIDGLLRAAASLVVAEGETDFAAFVHRWLRRPIKRRFPEIFFAHGAREEQAA